MTVSELCAPASAKKIIAEVLAETGVTCADIMGPSRRGVLTKARIKAWARLRRETKLSFYRIGAIFNRDHATIIRVLKRAAA